MKMKICLSDEPVTVRRRLFTLQASSLAAKMFHTAACGPAGIDMETITLDYKKRVVAAMKRKLDEDLEAALRQQKEIADSATHEEARAENDKDTRGLEQSYLARGLAQRVAELSSQRAGFQKYSTMQEKKSDRVVAGSLVQVVDEDDTASLYFIVDGSGAVKTTVSGRTIRTVSQETPVGKALLGQAVGDVVEIRMKGKVRELEVEACV